MISHEEYNLRRHQHLTTSTPLLADQKADCHTDDSNIVTVANGCMTEFVVDFVNLNGDAKRMGDISYCSEDWKSRVVEVRVYDMNALSE